MEAGPAFSLKNASLRVASGAQLWRFLYNFVRCSGFTQLHLEAFQNSIHGDSINTREELKNSLIQTPIAHLLALVCRSRSPKLIGCASPRKKIAMAKIVPCLWFDHNAVEAANFYTTLFPDSRVVEIIHAPADYPSGAAGAVILVKFTIAGQSFLGLNGGPQFKFSEAISFYIDCDDQAEIDRLWETLSSEGGEPKECGWLKDRYGLCWQIVPKVLPQLMSDPNDPARAARVMQAMMQMTKLDIAKLSAA